MTKAEQKLAAKFRAELKNLSLSPEDLAALFGVSPRTVGHWTTGVTRMPNWVVAALKLYSLLPPEGRRIAFEQLAPGHMPPVTPASPTAQNAAAPRASHPFARIEEL